MNKSIEDLNKELAAANDTISNQSSRLKTLEYAIEVIACRAQDAERMRDYYKIKVDQYKPKYEDVSNMKNNS